MSCPSNLFRNFRGLVALGWLLLLIHCSAVRCFVLPLTSEEATDILRGVSANDGNWYVVLNQTLKVAEKEPIDLHVEDMLRAVGMPGPEFKAQPVLKYLMTNPGSKSELNFGVKILGMAMSCQFMNTLVIHIKFLWVYGNRDTADVPSIRSYMSKIQFALAGYADKLAAVDQTLNHLMDVNVLMNGVFAKHDQDESIDKTVFTDCLNQILSVIKSHLVVRCGSTNEEDIVKTVRVNNFNDDIFKDAEIVDDFQLLAMIEDLDSYEYAQFDGLDQEFWLERLKIKPYVLEEEEIITEVEIA